MTLEILFFRNCERFCNVINYSFTKLKQLMKNKRPVNFTDFYDLQITYGQKLLYTAKQRSLSVLSSTNAQY